MKELEISIKKTGSDNIENLLDMVLHRYTELYPDWEIGTFVIQKSKDRNEQIDKSIRILQSLKNLEQ